MRLVCLGLLYNFSNKQQELIESAWHNVAHIVISKLDIQEVECEKKN